MSLTCYVLYSSYQIEVLTCFLKQSNANVFQPISCVEEKYIDLFDDINIFFNVKKAKDLFGTISVREIAQTLSHIKCWKEIANNPDIQENEFSLVAEANITLVDDFYNLAINYKNVYSSYGIIKLQRNSASSNELYTDGEDIGAVVYGNKDAYNGEGSSLYLIRKDTAKSILDKLQSNKPFWLSDYFTLFCEPSNIAQSVKHLSEQIKLQQKKIDNPLFSIIVPVYNVSKYLEECIDSVLVQKYNNYELILIDDGSTDTSLDICFKYAKENSNIVLVRKYNGGLSDARNYGLKIAKGEYVIFLDSDDYWEGEYVLNELAVLVEDKPDLIINYFTNLYPTNEKVIHKPELTKLNITGDFQKDYGMLFNEYIYLGFVWTKVVKRELFNAEQLYFIKDRKFEDIIWSFNLTKYIKAYKIYPSAFYIYRRNRTDSISSIVTKQNQKDLFKNMLELINEMPFLKMNFSHNYDVYLRSLKHSYDYSMTCYNLLSNEDKLELKALQELCCRELHGLI